MLTRHIWEFLQVAPFLIFWVGPGDEATANQLRPLANNATSEQYREAPMRLQDR